MVHWYRNVMGLRVLVRVVEDGYALLAAGETRLALLKRKSDSDASHRWSLAFEVENLDQLAERLSSHGAKVQVPKLNLEGFREILTVDPDGNRVRLFSWPERD